MSCCKMKSHRELRFHFTSHHWYRFCSFHIKALKAQKLKMGWTKETRLSGGCDVPWCDRKWAHEVYPSKKKIVSFWQPAKRRNK